MYIGLPLLFVYLYLFQTLYKSKYKAAPGASVQQLADNGINRLAAVKEH